MIDIKALLRPRTLLLAASCLFQMAAPMAATTNNYVVLSLIADKITIVQPGALTGSNMSRNVQEVIAMPDDSLDIVSLEEAEAAIKQIQPSATVDLFATRDPKLYAIQDAPEDGTDDTALVLDRLKKVLAQTKATQLVLITRHREDIRMRLHDSFAGQGKVAGVGFYLDEQQKLVDVDNGDGTQGYVAAFAVLRVRLIDLKAGKTVRSETVQSNALQPTPKSASSAWQGMNAQQKVDALRQVIRDAVGRAVPQALAAAP